MIKLTFSNNDDNYTIDVIKNGVVAYNLFRPLLIVILLGILLLITGCHTPSCDQVDSVADYDGNVYQTVEIGTQTWIVENLATTHYQNGDPIPHVPDEIEWRNLSGDGYSNYENSEINVFTYGRLYNLYAVNDDRGICPKGWYVPTAQEWKKLNTFLGGKLKEAGTAHWRDSNV